VERLLDKIITDNYGHFIKTAKQAIKKRAIDPADLVHEIIEHLYTRDQDYINEIVRRGKMVNYIDRAIRLSVYSSSSLFFIKYMKFTAVTCEFNAHLVDTYQSDYSKLIARENLDTLVQQLPTIERKALELYLLGYTYQELSQGTGIPLSYLYQTIKKAKQKIKI
jgi:RNA polymerase sigma factor (sigma-70 family)